MLTDRSTTTESGVSQEQRILVHAPVGRDAPMTVQFLRAKGYEATACPGVNDLCTAIREGAALVVITSETLESGGRALLQRTLAAQPPWSDIPIIVLAGGSEAAVPLAEVVLPVGNITVLERPVNPASLISAVHTALRARRQQYLVRDLLHQAEEARLAAEQNQAHIETLNERLRRAMTETHHRVKNNLQIIAAMVDMRLMDGADVIPIEDLRQLAAHIRVLASVHELLTTEAKESGQAHSVSAEKVLNRLLPMIQATTPTHRIESEVQDAQLTVRQGTSLALVANELVSNAVKYGRERVWVRFASNHREAQFEVCDDGPGFPPDFDPVRASNTGLELVQHLSGWDLGGRVSFKNRPEGGGCVCVTLPLADTSSGT